MQVLSFIVETVSGCGEMGSSWPGYEVRALKIKTIHNTDVFQRIVCAQEMDTSVMYVWLYHLSVIGPTTANK